MTPGRSDAGLDVHPRLHQEITGEIVSDLLGVIRGQFYGDASPKKWFQDRPFLLRNVVLWPASWLNKRGVSLKPERYKAIILECIADIKHHGATGVVQFWPGYLMHCVQEHFKHHGDEIYKEGKSLRTLSERAMMAFIRASEPVNQADPVRALSMARDAFVSGRRKRSRNARAPMLPGF
jgi:hypothetical protein